MVTSDPITKFSYLQTMTSRYTSDIPDAEGEKNKCRQFLENFADGGGKRKYLETLVCECSHATLPH